MKLLAIKKALEESRAFIVNLSIYFNDALHLDQLAQYQNLNLVF